VAGVIKIVQALAHEQLPKSLYCEEPSPHVDWSQGQIELLTSTVAWPRRGTPRRGGVSSFGISGTNAHLILEEDTPERDSTEPAARGESPTSSTLPLLLSAKSSDALAAAGRALHLHLSEHPELDQGAIAATLALHRTHFSERAAILPGEREQLLAGLQALAEDQPAANLLRGRTPRKRTLAFMFPGQGSQWQGMALELLGQPGPFAAQMRTCELALEPFVEWSLEDVLRGAQDAPSLERVDVVQPALFAVMVSLAALWRAHGVEPDLVIGHSQGEIAAAAVAGALSLEDAARIVALRSRALSKLAGSGGMVSVLLSQAELDPVLDELGLDVSLAAVNAPRSLVLSGSPHALDALIVSCEARGIRARRIAVDYASHSSQVETIREELLEQLAPIAPTAGSVPLYSTLTGERIDTTELAPEYWYRSLRETVQFHAAACGGIADGADVFIEVSPHPVLAPAVMEIIDDPDTVAVMGTLRRGEGGAERFTRSLAEAHVHGIEVDFQVRDTALVELPSYPFARKRYWIGPAASAGDARGLGQSPAEHPLLDAKLELPDDRGYLYTGRVSLERHPWLGDHTVAGTTLLPASVFVELALAAGSEAGADVLEELTLQAPLVLHGGSAVQVRLALTPLDEREGLAIEIHSRPEPSDTAEEQPSWVCHATGTLGVGEPAHAHGLVGEAWPPPGSEPVDVAELYGRLDARGLTYGPAFQGLQRAWRRGEELFGEVALDSDQENEAPRFGAHPVLLDCALHLAALADPGALALPFSFSGVRPGRRGASAWRVRMSVEEGTISLQACDESGAPTLELDSLRLRPFDPAQLQGLQGERDSLFALRWVDVEDDTRPTPSVAEVQTPEQLASLASAPELLLHRLHTGESDTPLTVRARELTGATLSLLQAFLAEERFADARLAFLTTRAVDVSDDEASDLAQAPLWGLIRSAQSEHPGRLLLIDTDRSEASERALTGALALDEPQLAIRDGRVMAARLQPLAAAGFLLAPAGEPSWRLEIEQAGSFDGLALIAAPDIRGALPDGNVRVGVRAAGINFLDVMASLGVVDRGEAPLGSEGAGVVLEVGPGVSSLAVGDRVMGIMSGSFAPLAICDERLLARMPAGWSFEQGASVAIAFLTAHYGLIELAALKPGESVLIHSGAGGVGMAAIQIARRLGAEVFATASPQKWPALESLGLDASHIASSRDHAFRDEFLRQTGGRGIDVILNSLAHELTDASLELASPDGRFVEMGKTDVRDPGEVAAKHAGLAYRAFDLAEAGPARLSEMLTALVESFESGELEPLPTTTFELESAPAALRHLSQARHTGKVLLRIPPALDPNRTVLITGGTGALGTLLARHLADVHGARHLLLTSRRGPSAPGAEQLVEQLEELGASTRVLACDISNREALGALLQTIPPEHPLGAVIHLAGAREDGVISSLEPDDFERAFVSKLDGAVHLHELTREADLSAFVMYSSAAATLGSPGQGSYSAANAFLDALAARRRAEGLPAQSIAWGLWAAHSEMTGELTDAERARLGALTLSSNEGLSLFDQACSTAQPFVLAAPLDGVQRPAKRRREQRGSFAKRLLETPAGELEAFVLELVRAHAAAVLGYGSPREIEPGRAFQEVGFDSLSALEFRNRLAAETGLRLPATLAFDYPSATAVSAHLLERYSLAGARSESEERELELQRAIASIPLWRLRSAGLLDPLLELSGRGDERPAGDEASAIAGMDVEHLVARALAGGATSRREKVSS
jgi:polyketide synthase 12